MQPSRTLKVMTVRHISLSVAAAALFAVGCQKSKTPSSEEISSPIPSPSAEAAASSPTVADSSGLSVQLPDPVATVNEEKISRELLLKDLNDAAAANGMKLSDLAKDQQLGAARLVLDQIITEKLVEAASANEQVSDAEVKAELQKVEQQFPSQEEFKHELQKSGQTLSELQARLTDMLKRRKWVERQIAGKDQVTEADAKKFYEANIKEFEHGEEVGAQHILFLVPKDATEQVIATKKEEAMKAMGRAKKGEDFATLARELSEEPGAKQTGGDLGYFAKDRMVKEFSDKAFSLKPGDISDPVRTQFGWHIIKVTGRKPAGTTPFDEVKVQLITMLKNGNQRAATQETLKNLREKAKVKILIPAPSAAGEASGSTPSHTPGAAVEPTTTPESSMPPEPSATPELSASPAPSSTP